MAPRNKLNVEDKNRKPGQGCKAGTTGIKFDLRNFFDPPAAGKHGDGDGNAEESLSKRGVCGGNGRRKEEENRDAAENPLRDDRGEGREAEIFHPAALFRAPGPDGEDRW